MKKVKLPIHLSLIFLLSLCWTSTNRSESQKTAAQTTPKPSTTVAGVGAKYKSRDPHTCPDLSKPTSGAPSAIQASQYVTCSREREIANTMGTDLILLDDVIVRVGAARKYDSNHDRVVNDLNALKPIFPITGSFKRYQCHVVTDYMQNAGKNCYLFNDSNASGLCYISELGGWRCVMDDFDETRKMLATEAAPPK